MKYSDPKEWTSPKPDHILLCRHRDNFWHPEDYADKTPFQCPFFIRGKKTCDIDKYPCDGTVFVPLLTKKELWEYCQRLKSKNPKKKGLINIET